jgi:hypothetical protein
MTIAAMAKPITQITTSAGVIRWRHVRSMLFSYSE